RGYDWRGVAFGIEPLLDTVDSANHRHHPGAVWLFIIDRTGNSLDAFLRFDRSCGPYRRPERDAEPQAQPRSRQRPPRQSFLRDVYHQSIARDSRPWREHGFRYDFQ